MRSSPVPPDLEASRDDSGHGVELLAYSQWRHGAFSQHYPRCNASTWHLTTSGEEASVGSRSGLGRTFRQVTCAQPQ